MKAAYAALALVMVVVLLFARASIALKFNETSAYQSCIRSPSTCWSLSLIRNQLTGTIPSELGLFTRLTLMNVWGNHLTGTLPLELTAMTSLTRIDYQHNQLTGTLPSELGLLTRLEWMILGDNLLSGTLSSELGALTSLGVMRLDHNRLTGTLPSEMGALTRLHMLYVCNNVDLCGDIPAGVTPDYGREAWQCLSGPTSGTRLGSDCPTSAPTAGPTSVPTSAPTGVSVPTNCSREQPLKENWLRKREVARKMAFPQRLSWFRKQAKRASASDEGSA
mmetsp:Transcript_31265/g.60297  ORF Transcript_31265/g.60297 Transcript_31265/m.60297 type:complete len:278 (-) Transcript_31265:398-1231(-)|eukprot:CAMPEP_0114256190 /NCGR_PEP_ID=MMETSP0058-20121206/18003_1 /TAXON_ID=36894 /ORGANISM="Pyramimonas parkeae, CCMP726" /LENGTH=277 /DNA_ID=CAMNT_0001370705 /DNA_START=110 /DNA_END=943 /DNA_ORIENTATION=-